MKKLSFLKCFVETLPAASESLVKTLRATSLLGMMVLAPMGATAQVTIGSDALPQATLDIIGAAGEIGKAFRLDDGNQANGKVLTVDGDNAVATWQYPALTILQSRNPLPATAKSVLIKDYPETTHSVFIDSDYYIDLEPGRYMIIIYTPVFFDFSLEAFETLKYQIGLIKAGGDFQSQTLFVRGPYNGASANQSSNFDRQLMIRTLDTSSDATTTRYYVGYGCFNYFDATKSSVLTTCTNAATNTAYFRRSGAGGTVYAIPMTQ